MGWGGVGLITFLCTCRNQAATVKRGGGVGWAGIITSLALQPCVLMHFHTYVMLVRFCAFSCTFTHTSC